MAKSSLIDEFDEAVEKIMSDPKTPLASLNPSLEAMLRIAGDLRDLPSESFRERLKEELLSGARAGAGRDAAETDYGKVLSSEEDIFERLRQLEGPPRFGVFDLATGLRDVPDSTMRFFAPLNRCLIGVSRGTEASHWEIHPAGDELLYFLGGEAEIVTRTDKGVVRSPVRAGSLFICPRGLWHRIEPRSPITMFFATPGEGTNAMSDEPPAPTPGAWSQRTGKQRAAGSLAAHDLGAALQGLPELRIGESTTGAEADAAFRKITDLDECTIGVMSYAGQTPWERHPDGDELLYAIDGGVEITVLTDDGPVEKQVRAGSVFICPRGLWHRQRAEPSVTMLFGTPTETTEISFADDPRA